MNKVNKSMVIIGGLLVSGAVISGLAMAGNSGNFGHKHHHSEMNALKLDANVDGMLSQEELLARNVKRFQKLDADSNGMISADEYSAELVAMFTSLDANGDGLLSDDELPRRFHGFKDGHGYKNGHGKHRGHHDDQEAKS